MNVCSTTVNLINLRLGVVKELLRSTDFEKCIGVYQSKNLYTSSSSPNRRGPSLRALVQFPEKFPFEN